MALLFLLVAMALALSISGAPAAVAAPSLQSTIIAPATPNSPGLPVCFTATLRSDAQVGADIAALDQRELTKQRQRNAYILRLQVLKSESKDSI